MALTGQRVLLVLHQLLLALLGLLVPLALMDRLVLLALRVQQERRVLSV
jgi:hypothetical protein